MAGRKCYDRSKFMEQSHTREHSAAITLARWQHRLSISHTMDKMNAKERIYHRNETLVQKYVVKYLFTHKAPRGRYFELIFHYAIQIYR